MGGPDRYLPTGIQEVAVSADERIEELGLVLPSPPEPIASYVTFVRTGSVVYTSGHGPLRADGTWIVGKVGADMGIEEAAEAARITGLGIVATLRSHLGSLDYVGRVVKILGMINCTPDFTDHPSVINGCSDLFAEVFGDVGRHARSAVGVASLPMGIPVEIEAIVEIRSIQRRT
jgi:enamine deaminase RidA (YjgF/YER057c/UK114 family)